MVVLQKWIVNEISCWSSQCNYTGGYCPELCGQSGYCCSKNPMLAGLNGDCPIDALSAIETLTNKTDHVCVQPYDGKRVLFTYFDTQFRR